MFSDKRPSAVEVSNDTNRELVNFYRVAKERLFAPEQARAMAAVYSALEILLAIPEAGKLNDMKLEIPELLYHGSYRDFGDFDDRYRRSNTGWENTIHGFFFADKLENALLFGPWVYSATVSIIKPLDLRIHGIFSTLAQAPAICEIAFGRTLQPRSALSLLNREIGLGEIADLYEALNSQEANDLFKKAGYDGIVSDLGDYQNEYIAFSTEQIKILQVQNYGEERHLNEVHSRRRS